MTQDRQVLLLSEHKIKHYLKPCLWSICYSTMLAGLQSVWVLQCWKDGSRILLDSSSGALATLGRATGHAPDPLRKDLFPTYPGWLECTLKSEKQCRREAFVHRCIFLQTNPLGSLNVSWKCTGWSPQQLVSHTGFIIKITLSCVFLGCFSRGTCLEGWELGLRICIFIMNLKWSFGSSSCGQHSPSFPLGGSDSTGSN